MQIRVAGRTEHLDTLSSNLEEYKVLTSYFTTPHEADAWHKGRGYTLQTSPGPAQEEGMRASHCGIWRGTIRLADNEVAEARERARRTTLEPFAA
jgi:hypothetical protein